MVNYYKNKQWIKFYFSCNIVLICIYQKYKINISLEWNNIVSLLSVCLNDTMVFRKQKIMKIRKKILNKTNICFVWSKIHVYLIKWPDEVYIYTHGFATYEKFQVNQIIRWSKLFEKEKSYRSSFLTFFWATKWDPHYLTCEFFGPLKWISQHDPWKWSITTQFYLQMDTSIHPFVFHSLLIANVI